MIKDTITIQEAAKCSNLSVATIRRYLLKALFKYEKGKQGLKNFYRIDKDSFFNFCKENDIMIIEVF